MTLLSHVTALSYPATVASSLDRIFLLRIVPHGFTDATNHAWFSEGGQRPRDFVEGLNGVNASCDDVLTQLAFGFGPSSPYERYGNSASHVPGTSSNNGHTSDRILSDGCSSFLA